MAPNPWDNDSIVKTSNPWDNDPIASSDEPGIADYAAGFGGGFNKGLAGMAGLPVDMANALIGAVGIPTSDKPIGGSRFFREMMPESMTPDAPDNLAGRVLARTGEEIGASVLPAAGIMGAAARSAPAASNAARSFGQAFLDPIRRSPALAASGELAAATGAGVGAGVAMEAAPDSQIAEMAGQVAGGMAPTALMSMPTALAARGAASLYSKISPAAQTRAGQRAVQETLGQELTPEAMRSLEQAERLRREIPGFDPTLGEATGSPALLSTQRDLERRASGAELEELAARRSDSEKAVGEYSRAQAPGGDGSPEYIIDTASRTVDDLRSRIADAESAVVDRRGEVASGIPEARRDAAGATIRERMDAEIAGTRERLSLLADQLGINDADMTVQFDRARHELLAEFTPASVFEDAANAPRVLNDIKASKGKPVTFRDLKSLRERVSDDLIDAIGAANPSRKQVRDLSMMKGRIDGIIEETTRSADPDLATRYQQFRKAYFDEYVDRFEKGAAFKVRQKDGRGFYRTPDEQVADAFFERGNVSAAKQYNSVFRDDPEAASALEAVALDRFRTTAVVDGVIDPKRAQAWMASHASVLDELPGLRSKLAEPMAANDALWSRQQQIAGRSKVVDDQLLTRALDSYGRGTRQPDAIINDALRDPRKMAQLSRVLRRTPEALDALRRQVWEQATTGSAADTLRFLERATPSLGAIYGSNHIKAITNIAAARAMMERSPVPTGSAITARPLQQIEEMIGQGVPQLSSRLFAWRSGRMQKGYLAVDTISRGLRGRAQQSADSLFRQALYDPEVAKEMLNAMIGVAPRPETASRLQARLFALGIAGEEDQ